MATGLLLLYIPPDWSLRHTWSVHSIHEKMPAHYMFYMMYITILHFVHDAHHNTLTHYKVYMMRELRAITSYKLYKLPRGGNYGS